MSRKTFTILLKRGHSEARETFIPRKGELILETDTQLLYVGDGKTPGGRIIKNCSTLVNKIMAEKLQLDKSLKIISIQEWEDLI